MKTRNIFTKVSIVIALVAFASTLTIWQVRRVLASGGFERTVGMIGVTRGQTVRLNIVDLAVAVDGLLPPDPCRVVLTFRNADGRPFINSDGQPLRRVVELQVGQSAFLDLNADMYFPVSDAVGSARMQLRPFVRVQSQPSGDLYPADPCRATMEVIDNSTGRTSIFATGFAQPPEPD